MLVVQTLLWPDEVRSSNFISLDDSPSIKPAELKMASMLVDSFADDFHPENYVDDYRVELEQLIEAKLEGEEAFPTREKKDEGEDAEVVDLLAALQRSVDRHRSGSAADGDGSADASSGSSRSSGRSSTRSSSSKSSGSSRSSSSRSSSKKAGSDTKTTTKTREPATTRRRKTS